MLKRVSFGEYQIIRKIHKQITIIVANDTEAVILIGK